MAGPGFSIDAAQIVGLFMESVFYGIFLVTFASCMRVLLFSSGGQGNLKPSASINYVMVSASVAMFIFGTMDVGFGLRHNLDAFVYFNGPPDEEFAQISYWVNVMKIVCYDAQTFVGDAILIYRCFVIYGRSWLVIVLPLVMWLAGTACGIMTVFHEATIGIGVLNQSQLKPWINGVISITLMINVLTTGLIIYRIWKIQSDNQRLLTTISNRNSPYRKVIRILIESGFMYTLSVIVLFVCYMASNNAQLGVSDSIVQIIGITFNLIILSVDRGTSIELTSVLQPTRSSGTRFTTSPSLPMRKLNIRCIAKIEQDFPIVAQHEEVLDLRLEKRDVERGPDVDLDDVSMHPSMRTQIKEDWGA